MTQQRFFELCGAASIDPHLALEQDGMAHALQTRDDDEVERILREEF